MSASQPVICVTCGFPILPNQVSVRYLNGHEHNGRDHCIQNLRREIESLKRRDNAALGSLLPFVLAIKEEVLSGKLYKSRSEIDLELSGGYYSRHVSGMTRENLHSKADIAAQLAYRDFVIDMLCARLQAFVDCDNKPEPNPALEDAFKPKRISLDEFNTSRRHQQVAHGPILACPKCDGDMHDDPSDADLLSLPPKKTVICGSCGHYNYRLL